MKVLPHLFAPAAPLSCGATIRLSGDLVDTNEFVRHAKNILQSELETRGAVIYSHKSTLRPDNDVIFLGYNPGGCVENYAEHSATWRIGASLDRFADGFEILREASDHATGDVLNLIDHQTWMRTPTMDWPTGEAPYQQRVRCLLHKIDSKDALVANLFFRQSRNAEVLRATPGHEQHAENCWRIHEMIFNITRPRVIITFKASIDEALRRKFQLEPQGPPKPAGQGTRTCQHYRGARAGNTIDVVAIDHLWIYRICEQQDVLRWINDIVAKAKDKNRQGTNRG